MLPSFTRMICQENIQWISWFHQILWRQVGDEIANERCTRSRTLNPLYRYEMKLLAGIIRFLCQKKFHNFCHLLLLFYSVTSWMTQAVFFENSTVCSTRDLTKVHLYILPVLLTAANGYLLPRSNQNKGIYARKYIQVKRKHFKKE
ncbi:putative integral membrane protein [Brugia pahangi]